MLKSRISATLYSSLYSFLSVYNISFFSFLFSSLSRHDNPRFFFPTKLSPRPKQNAATNKKLNFFSIRDTMMLMTMIGKIYDFALRMNEDFFSIVDINTKQFKHLKISIFLNFFVYFFVYPFFLSSHPPDLIFFPPPRHIVFSPLTAEENKQHNNNERKSSKIVHMR